MNIFVLQPTTHVCPKSDDSCRIQLSDLPVCEWAFPYSPIGGPRVERELLVQGIMYRYRSYPRRPVGAVG
eukprot:COSAG03_NODE_9_length_23924_cov_40.675690_5_plen_70_part_00